jgi:cystathionine beta-lyase/cystathionine gamma-synthase
MKKQLEFATRAIHAGQAPDPSTGAVMTPIYATSTYVQESPGKHKGYDYARSINPTRLAYEKCIADLESGTRGFAFASGLAAMATVLELLESGSHIVASDDLYGGTFRLFEKVRRRSANLDFTYADLTEAKDLERAIKPSTRMVWIETPSNPLLKLIDLEAIAKIARERKIISVCDNTFATPWIQRPIETVCTCDVLMGGFFAPLDGITKFILLSRSGVVIMNMMSSTKARSSSGVILISLNVERLWRWE